MSTEPTTDPAAEPTADWTPKTGDRVVLVSDLFEPFVKDGTLGTIDYAPDGWPILVRWDTYQINIGHENDEVRLATPEDTATDLPNPPRAPLTVVTR